MTELAELLAPQPAPRSRPDLAGRTVSVCPVCQTMILWPRADELAGRVGWSPSMDATLNQFEAMQREQVEHQIADHLDGHSVVEFVTALNRAQQQRDAVVRALRSVKAAFEQIELAG